MSLPTLLFAEIVRRAAREFNAGKTEDLVPDDIFQVAVGGPEVGKSLVADEQVAKVVVTGSIPVCEKVKEVGPPARPGSQGVDGGRRGKFRHRFRPTRRHDAGAYLDFVVGAVLKSVLPYGGQKCIGATIAGRA